MGSKGRIPPPPPHHHHPGRPAPFPGPPPPMRAPPPPGHFPPYGMLLPHEAMEQKLAAQHEEMQRVAVENHRLAATHGTLRQELAASQHELQALNSRVEAARSDAARQARAAVDRIAEMEAGLKAAEPLETDLRRARAEAQKLAASRQDLAGKAQVLSTDLQRAHVDVQQIPALMAELDSLRQEYQHYRATYDYEKKLYNDHLESLQVMEKNYMNMAREVEKLRGELMNPTYADRRPVPPYGVAPGGNESDASGHPVAQNAYEDGYSALQGRGPPATAGSAVASAPVPAGTSTYAGAQSGPAPSSVATYDLVRGHGGGYGSNYDPQRGQGYEVQRGGPGYDPSRAAGAAGPHSHITSTGHAPYGSATPPQPAHGGNNPVRR